MYIAFQSSRVQLENEPVEEFIQGLKKLAITCNLRVGETCTDNSEQEAIRDRIVFGVHQKRIVEC